MKFIFLLAFSFSLSVVCHAQEDSLKSILQEGVQLHDKGDYAGAIRKYDQIIGLNSKYYTAYVEKAYSLYASGKFEDCIGLCRKTLKEFPDNDGNKNIYVNYGSALDGLGKSGEAIKVYKEGMRKFPEFYLLPFNKGTTEYNNKNYEDAIVDMQTAIKLNPMHTSSHQYLGYSIYTKNKMAAAMALATFLMLEPTGQRAEKNLKVLLQILQGNVEQQDAKHISISLSPSDLETKGKGEDDFHLTELTMNLASAADMSISGSGDTTVAGLAKKITAEQRLEKKLGFLAEASSSKKGFFSNFYVALFSGLKSAGLLEVTSHILYLSANETDNRQWLQANKEKMEEFGTFLKEHMGK